MSQPERLDRFLGRAGLDDIVAALAQTGGRLRRHRRFASENFLDAFGS
jgi:hypothetical protein